MIPKPIDDVCHADILELVENKVPEGPRLEYKECLPSQGADDKREFLYDISSFANAGGGDLIYGVQEERDAAGKPTGIPAAIQPMDLPNSSAELLRLENMIRDSIAPRILGIVPKVIEAPPGAVLILRIPKSWHSPHMVTFAGASKFYSRGSGGKFPMDVGQLRVAFNATSSLPDRIRDLRLERLGRIVAGETPVEIGNGPKLTMHLLPLSALESSAGIEEQLSADAMPLNLPPLYGSGWSHRYNFDGIVTFTMNEQNLAGGYVQLFRSGLLEAVDCQLLDTEGNPKEWKDAIPSTLFEERLLRAAHRLIAFLNQAGISCPIFVLVTLVGVKGLHMAMRTVYRSTSLNIDRDTLLVPEVTIERFASDLCPQLRPICDAIWRSAGINKSPNFDDKGQWHAPR
jgi:hypothetical protein